MTITEYTMSEIIASVHDKIEETGLQEGILFIDEMETIALNRTGADPGADTIVNALGSKKNVFDDSKLTVPFTYVGDCSGERTADIASAIRTGYKAANEI